MLPEDLIKRAQEATGEGLTPTVRQGLEMVAASKVYDTLLKLKGKLPELAAELRKLQEEDDE